MIRQDGTEADVPAAEAAVDDRFIVRGGDRIPLDGEVVDGAGVVDQAPITGESAGAQGIRRRGLCRHDRRRGDFDGARDQSRIGHRAAKIIRMVGDAHARRLPVEQRIAKLARVYTPSATALAIAIAIALVLPLLLGGVWDYCFYNALVLLVSACLCALVISTPVSIVAALTASALAMDKTGTITMGEPEVAAVSSTGRHLRARSHDAGGKSGSAV